MDYLRKIRPCLLEAQKAILEIYNTDFSVSYKEDKSPLTIADEKAEKIIFDCLKSISDYPIIGEETFSKDHKCSDCKDYWLVDPLDGTSNFVKKTGDFAISIGLIKDNKPFFGVIYKPTTSELFYAEKEKGAFLEKDGKITKLSVNTEFSKGVTIVFNSSAYGKKETIERYLKKISPIKSKNIGSTALKICSITTKEADIFPKQTELFISEWDIAGAHIILKEAGGNLFDDKGQEISYCGAHKKVENFIATSQKLFNIIK